MAERKDLVVTREQFPSNAHSEHEKVEKKKVKKVVKGKVVKRKKSLGEKFGETFLEEDGKNVGAYILYDILIPAAKDTISDLVKGGVEMLLYGEGGSRGRSTYRDRGRSYSQSRVSYNRMYGEEERRVAPRRERRNRNRYNFDDIILDSREEAKEVLDSLMDLIGDYDIATVEDFYDLIGMTSEWVDCDWGWRNLNDAYIERARGGGWIVCLPKPVDVRRR